MFRYVRRDLLRNPRRTIASLIGVILGVGLFSGVLFFIDGSGASMTKRSLAPLALDMQVILNSPLGTGVTLSEKVVGPRALGAGQRRRVLLTVRNTAAAPGNEVVIADVPPAGLAYVPSTTTLNGKRLSDAGGHSPLSQGPAGTGLNLGTVRAGKTVRIAYEARASRPIANAGALHLRGQISTREDVVPTPANSRPDLALSQLARQMARIPGVSAVDGLAFVDLPPSALTAGGRAVDRTVRLFAFDASYARHYPSIHVVSGALSPTAAVISAEAARQLGAVRGGTLDLRLPGRAKALSLPVGGVADLSQAKPLFYSRKSTNLEEFNYVPDAVVVSPALFRSAVIPAFRVATAARGTQLKSLPFLEADVLVDRARLQADPAAALGQTKAIASAIHRVQPTQQYLLDDVSNTLQVARDDAAVGKRMFLFLGLPGGLLAAFLAAYTASVLAVSQRREHANLRIRGAHRGHLVRMLGYRTAALASVGSVAGAALGLVVVLAILGSSSLFEASAGSLVVSALAAVGLGTLITGLALYIPARRSLSREISQERMELSLAPAPAWRRLRLDFALLAAAGIAEAVALGSGVFDAPPGSVYNGQAVSLPSYLLLAPAVAWFGGILLCARGVQAVSAHAPVPAPPRFGSLLRGTLTRSLRRRSWTLATGAVGVGLVLAFGTALAMFTATYDAAKAADSRFTVGSDIRVTPSVLSTRPHPPGFAAQLRVPGVAATTPVVYKIGNAILTSKFNEDRKSLAAIDPAGFERVATLPDKFFVGGSAAAAMQALKRDPSAILVEQHSAGDLHIRTGDTVRVLLARATRQQVIRKFRVAGQYSNFPGFPQGADIVVGLGAYTRATGLRESDFFLAQTTGRDPRSVARVAGALRAGPASRDRLGVETTGTALNKDQSSLTALNVHGLVDLDSLFTLLIAAASVGIFVFGLMLARRREYVVLRAQGLRSFELRSLVLSETALMTASGLAGGVLVGSGLAYLMIRVLRPLFVLDPHLALAPPRIAILAALASAAALVSALAATAILRRLKPTEILRET